VQRVSIITATFNNGDFLDETIQSVLAQDYRDWEWIIINNGSTDSTYDKLQALKDERILVITLPENLGVSKARNIGLDKMTGDFFCFLDGDDILPTSSLSSRLHLFNTDECIGFVDGQVIDVSSDGKKELSKYTPNYSGDPLPKLCMLSSDVFKGNSWMIKRDLAKKYAFHDALTHGEELLFYMKYATGAHYTFTNEPVLLYRRHQVSAMNNIVSLAKAYLLLPQLASEFTHINSDLRANFNMKCQKIAIRSLLKAGHFKAFFKLIPKFLPAR
jgi:glycosyltransferase involved in cell wall biosynthesis